MLNEQIGARVNRINSCDLVCTLADKARRKLAGTYILSVYSHNNHMRKALLYSSYKKMEKLRIRELDQLA